jgi:hypothetical protein
VVVSNVDKKVILQEIVHQVDQEEVVMVDVIVIAVEIVDVIVTDEDQDQDLDHKINDIPFNCLSKIKKNKSSI